MLSKHFLISAGVLLAVTTACTTTSTNIPRSELVRSETAQRQPSSTNPIMMKLTQIADAADSKSWIAAPDSLAVANLARVLLSGGKRPGVEVAVVQKNTGVLEIWEARYDQPSQSDMAHLLGTANKVGVGGAYEDYAATLALFPLEAADRAALSKSIPYFVTKKNDETLYVWWPSDTAPVLFQVSAD